MKLKSIQKFVALVCALGAAAPAFATESPTVIPLYSMIPLVITSVGSLSTARVFHSAENVQGDIGTFPKAEKRLVEQLQSRGCSFAFEPTQAGDAKYINVTDSEMSCTTEGAGNVVVSLAGSLQAPSGTGLKSLKVGDKAIFLVQKGVTF